MHVSVNLLPGVWPPSVGYALRSNTASHENRAKIKSWVSPRDHDLREPVPHTWDTFNGNLFQSNFSAWSSREPILGTTPDWPI